MSQFHFGKYAGFDVAEVDTGYLLWVLGNVRHLKPQFRAALEAEVAVRIGTVEVETMVDRKLHSRVEEFCRKIMSARSAAEAIELIQHLGESVGINRDALIAESSRGSWLIESYHEEFSEVH